LQVVGGILEIKILLDSSYPQGSNDIRLKAELIINKYNLKKNKVAF
jgi:hypothetical protein